jgi:hypothetical protein
MLKAKAPQPPQPREVAAAPAAPPRVTAPSTAAVAGTPAGAIAAAAAATGKKRKRGDDGAAAAGQAATVTVPARERGKQEPAKRKPAPTAAAAHDGAHDSGGEGPSTVVDFVKPGEDMRKKKRKAGRRVREASGRTGSGHNKSAGQGSRGGAAGGAPARNK